MSRICDPFSYSNGPVEACYWKDTVDALETPPLQGEASADVAIIGGGYTGLSAALHLAEAGHKVILLEEHGPGWGASGRNGGFCCLGGTGLDKKGISARLGPEKAREYLLRERDAVNLVQSLIERLGIEADTHSKGETLLAHRARDAIGLKESAGEISDFYGIDVEFTARDELTAKGMNGPFYGAMTMPIGFALNPLKYALGLARAAQKAGANLFGQSPVTLISGDAGAYRLSTPKGQVSAKEVVLATNAYARETLPKWMASRFMPAQSSIIVTRPLKEEELAAQGWTSDQMAYDTRRLLHYFRLMPDRRFLFGMRGGWRTSQSVHEAMHTVIRRDFETMFPAWRDVETPWYWSGFVCYSPSLMPFAGPVPNQEGLFAAFGYHGNGVAMGSYCGKLLADQITGRVCEPISTPPKRFPGGQFRRLALGPAYALYGLLDR